MDLVLNLFKEVWFARIFLSIITIVTGIIVYKIITVIIAEKIDSSKLKVMNNKKGQTYVKLATSIIRYIFIIAIILILLKINGINISSMLAGIGLAGVIFGLAIQDFLKDIIRGSSIISDNYFSVGDVIKYKEYEGKVISLGLKTTKIKDLKTKSIISIANRNIEEVELSSNMILVRIPMPYEVKLAKAEKAVNDIVELIKNNKDVDNCVYVGVTELADSSIQYLLEVYCNPVNKRQVNRDSLRSVLVGLSQNKIAVPYNQIDVHQK